MLKQNPGPGSYQTDQFYSKEWSRGSGKYSLGKSGRN